MITKYIDIVRDQLVLNLNTIDKTCYDRTGTTISNLVNPTDIGLLSGGTIFNNTNGSINFNGVDGFIDFPNPVSFNPSGMTGFSMSVWLINTGNTGGITNFYSGPSFDNGIELELYLGDIYVAFSSTQYGTFTYGLTDQWVNFSITYDGTGVSDSDKLKFYTNGIETPMSYVGTLPTTLDTTNVASFLIGVVRPTVPPDRYLECSIGQVLGYFKPLTSDEVRQNYNATKNWFV